MYTNNDGTIYCKRCVIIVNGDPKIVATSYDDMKELMKGLNDNGKTIGFGRDNKEEKKSN